MTVTAVTAGKKGSLSLFVDGEFAFPVDEETAAQAKLAPGLELGEEELESIRQKALCRAARERCLTLLSYKSYTRGMLLDRLRREHTEERAALAAVERMEELGLLDDEDYALRCSRDLVRLKGYGPVRVRQELARRRVSRAIIDRALEQFSPEEFQENLQAHLGKKYARDLASPKGKARALNAALRLGYSYEEARAAVSRLTEGEDFSGW